MQKLRRLVDESPIYELSSHTLGMQITPDTKIAALLKHYPELEELLIFMAPPFKKLRNPILRRTLAKVASLRQAAAVGKIPLTELINRLRGQMGHPLIEACEDIDLYFGPRPIWVARGTVVTSIDEEETDKNVMTLKPLMRRAATIGRDELLELRTNFVPAPAIDLMRNKGYLAWSVEDGDLVKTYFGKEP